jgi:hypothetical protein
MPVELSVLNGITDGISGALHTSASLPSFLRGVAPGRLASATLDGSLAPDRGRRGTAGRPWSAHPADPAGALASHSCGLTSRRGTDRSNSIPGRPQSIFGSFTVINEP